MRNFNDNRQSGGGGFGGRGGGGRSGGGFGGGRDRERPEMHRATCADCGDSCEVPFKPSSNKPVYCNHCFKREDSFDSNRGGGGGGDRGGRGGDRGGRGGFGAGRDRERPEMHKATCAECGNSCEVPFKPTNSKPVYCSDCFGGKGGGSNAPQKTASYKEDFEALNKKLDKILRVLEIAHPTKTHTIEKPAKKTDVETDSNLSDKKAKPAVKKKAVKKTPAKKVAKKKTTKKK